jgi:diguanylate cyclase (GGDEF)-like protein
MNILSRLQFTDILADVQTQLNDLESLSQKVFVKPGKEQLKDFQPVFQQLDEKLMELQRLGNQMSPEEVAPGLFQTLQINRQQLQQQIKELIDTPKSVQDGLPAMTFMLEGIYSNHQKVLRNLQQLCDEESGLTIDEKVKILTELAHLQCHWFGMTGQLRLLVLDHATLFSKRDKPQTQLRYANIEEHLSHFVSCLRKLQHYFTHERSNLLISEVIHKIEVNYLAWLEGYQQVRGRLDPSSWSTDLNFMQKNILPRFESMRYYLVKAGQILENQPGKKAPRAMHTTKWLSSSILVMASLGMILLFLAYQFIKRNLFQPIAQTASALKLETSGTFDFKKHLGSGESKKTQDLIDVFSEMRRQAYHRERHLDHLMHHDALTQLPNSVLFRDRLEHALAIALRGDNLVGLMILGLNRFKQVNDNLGYLVGDELLIMIANRLTSVMRSSDTVARLRGDEFAILIEGINQWEDLESLADKILKTVSEPVVIAGNELQISASIGIAVAPHDDVSVESLLRDADMAMCLAKRQEQSAYRFFYNDMNTHTSEQLHFQDQVRNALESKQFVFYFQPIIEAKTGRLFCYEAFLRWHHPDRGVLEANGFISVLNEMGLLNTLFSPMLKQALAFQKEQSRQHHEIVPIAINLSAQLVNDSVFCQKLLESIVSNKIPSGGLILEITEDVFTQSLSDTHYFLQQIRALGARIALDEFGSGPALLSRLRQFPFDLLKIDHKFIRNISADSNDVSLLTALVQLAHTFDIDVVAAGVESEDQLAVLQRQGCDYVQGYLVGTPQAVPHP